MRTLGLSLCLMALHATASAAPITHPAMRPLPVASNRPLASGPAYHVDLKAADGGDGSASKPYQTIGAALGKLKAGDTLVVHGGTYYERVTITQSGTAKAPITIRAAPGELAILDGGLRELMTSPSTSWEPVVGAPHEYRSTKKYPELAPGDKDRPRVIGQFADSMVPLHPYRLVEDFRSDNQYWNVPGDVAPGRGIYLGPGTWFDPESQRIHIRLAHTKLEGQRNYTGSTDPRKLPLVIGAGGSVLRLDGAAHVRVQDLVIRGAVSRTVEIANSHHIELDGLTVYGGAPAMRVDGTYNFRMIRSSLRGLAAPWSSRASMKYRGNSPYLFVAGNQPPRSHSWELAYNEFTDSHDGIVLDSLKDLQFHHNRIDNINDDGLYLMAPPRAFAPEGVHIYENIVSRVLTTLAFAQDEDRKPTPIGPGIYVYRNLFDLREGTYNRPPKAATEPPAITPSRMCGDHGDPVWEPLFFYQNTVINAVAAWRGYYGAMLVMGTRDTRRRIFNNIFVQIDGNPGLVIPGPTDDVQADGNLLWGLRDGRSAQGEFFAARQAKPAPAGFGVNDVFTDPVLTRLTDNDPILDIRPRGVAGKSAIDAGVKLPPEWPDSLRAADKAKPDIGALPLGAPMLVVGPSALPAR